MLSIRWQKVSDEMTPSANFRLKKQSYRSLLILFFLLLFVCFFYLPAPEMALADSSITLEIIGEGVTTPLTFTLEELEAMEQYEQVYSTINTWPTKRWYMARGVKLRELLALAGIKEEATLLKFIGKDDYQMTLTVQELLEDKRYYFPGLKENHSSDGSIPGSPEGAVEVEPIIALVSAEDSDDPDEMDERNGLMLVVGQRAITEQTWLLFTKWIHRIQVLTTEPEKWDAPKTYVPDGSAVPLGFKLELKNKDADADKIYYTTDGSTPTVNSPMFNWSARRWWEQRENADSINIPIEIIEDMIRDSIEGRDAVVFKARTIGPGKLDSDVVTFTFTVDPDAMDPTKLPGEPPTGLILDRSAIELRIGGTFRLEATVEPFNALDKKVVWSSSDTSVATVDTGGLVTVVGTGTAVITVETADGKYSATCVINGPDQAREEEEVYLGEDDEQIPVTTTEDESAGALGQVTVSNPDAQPDTEEPEEDKLPFASNSDEIPEGRGRYLVEKAESATVTIAADHYSGQTENHSQRVFEISLDPSIPLTLPEQQRNVDLQTAVVLLFFFLSGAGRRYLEYAKEL